MAKMLVTQHLQKSAVTLLKQNGLRKMPKKGVKKEDNFYLQKNRKVTLNAGRNGLEK